MLDKSDPFVKFLIKNGNSYEIIGRTETIKNELLFCTGETYLKNKETLNQMTNAEIDRERKIAINAALQNYKILSYKTFYKKVLGEKITEIGRAHV